MASKPEDVRRLKSLRLRGDIDGWSGIWIVPESSGGNFLRWEWHETQTVARSSRGGFENLFRNFSLMSFVARRAERFSSWIRPETKSEAKERNIWNSPMCDDEKLLFGLGLFMSDDSYLVPYVKHLLHAENYGLRVSKALVWISEGWSFRSDSTDTPHRLKAQLKFIFRRYSYAHTSVSMTTPMLTWTQKIIYHQSQSHNSRIISYAPPTTVNRSQPRNTRHRKEKRE